MVRDLGDSMRLEYATYDADGDPIAATVTLTVTDPAGATTTPAVTTPSVGVYRSSFTLNQVGMWLWTWQATGTVVDVQNGEVTVSDTVAEDATWYTSLSKVKMACGISPTDIEKDDIVRDAIAGACRGIDNDCGFPRRRFWRDVDPVARTFAVGKRGYYDRCTGEFVLSIDDLASIDDLVLETSTDGITWTNFAATSQVIPCGMDDDRNAPDNLQAVVELRSYGSAWWGAGRLVRITERWGWPAVPDTIVQGATLQSSRLLARRGSPEGVAGNAEWGIARVSRLDPDVRRMISNYILDGIA